jgi:hypothetical protein
MPRRLAPVAASATMTVLASLHVLWGLGSSWPAKDRTRLAELSAGTEQMPGSAECFAVAAAVSGAAATVALGSPTVLGPALRTGVAAVFLIRGVTGLTGRTALLVPWAPAEEFVRHDRRYYGPLCLGIGALVAIDLRSR